MPVLVDGNNLIYAARDANPEGIEVGRALLCHYLGEWAQRRGEALRVVFDGPGPELAARAQQIGHPAIEVLYSGGGVKADEVLSDLIEADSAARRLTVVSTDREVARAARRKRATPMRSDDFWSMLQRDLSRPPRTPLEPPEKFEGLNPDATERWLRELGLD